MDAWTGEITARLIVDCASTFPFEPLQIWLARHIDGKVMTEKRRRTEIRRLSAIADARDENAGGPLIHSRSPISLRW